MRSTQASGSRMIRLKRLMTAWRTMAPRLRANQPSVSSKPAAASRLTSSVIARSPFWTEDSEQDGHDEHHGDRSDQGDGGGVALSPEAEFERLVVHEDRPSISRRSAVEAAEYEILVEHRHRRAEPQDDQDHHDRGELRPRHMPEHLPLARAVDARRVTQFLRDRREAGDKEDGVVAETPPHFHDRDRGQRERRSAKPLRRVLQREQS